MADVFAFSADITIWLELNPSNSISIFPHVVQIYSYNTPASFLRQLETNLK